MPVPIDTEAQAEAQRRRPSRCLIPISRNRGRNKGNEAKKRKPAEYGDTSSTYWNLYLSEAGINDKNLVETLEGDTNSMLIINGLFSSIVGSFIIETYKTLLPDGGQQSPFKPSSIAVRMNIVMFFSLFLSMTSLVACALIQQWCREFMKYAYPRAPPHKRGRVRTYLFRGLDQFQMRRFMYGIHVLLHIAVFLFFWGLSDFLYNAYQPVGTVARYSLLTSVVVYTAFSISPLIFVNSPYHTALTPPIRFILFLTSRIICCFLPCSPGLPFSWLRHFNKGIRFNRAHFLVDEADAQAWKLDHHAMQWLFLEDDLSDHDMDTFLEALPGYIHSHFTDRERLHKELTTNYILKRIREHFLTCATSFGLSQGACIARVAACVNSLRLIFQTSGGRFPPSGDKEELRKNYIQGVIDDLNRLCDGPDPTVALRASCVRSLAFQGLLTHLTHPGGDPTPHQAFPVHLIPLYTFICDKDASESVQQLDNAHASTSLGDKERMWNTLLHDGPLVNLSLLAKAALSRKPVHPSSLSLCWKTLDTLLKEFRISQMEVSESALARFNKEYENTHERVHVEHRVTPLLEALDTVARGRRLSMVFLDHPEYHSRADVVFGKEQLKNSNLLEAFAHCLPNYIAKIPPDERREFMEGMVCDDDLWTSLLVNLWKAVQSDNPIPEKQRIFEACCAVLDTAFLALEDSNKVDWRAPEFGSLAQHFELFLKNCFQGTFMGRAAGFRIGLIKVRFCKALLAQFSKEADRGAVFLRSQWDVASLARLFYTLEVGDAEDAEFWKVFIDGGHIGAEFMTKARETLATAMRDGPLLSFCKLGHLAVTAVPFEASGLDRADIEKLTELQEKMLKDENVPRTSAEVWEELNRLRDEVSAISASSSGKDKQTMEQLLEMIEKANNLCASRSQPPIIIPTESSAHISSQPRDSDDNASFDNFASPFPPIHDYTSSRVANRAGTIASQISPVHPRLAWIRDPSRRNSAPIDSPTSRSPALSGTTTSIPSTPLALTDTDLVLANTTIGIGESSSGETNGLSFPSVL